ncbi:ankyrin and armadillo repeat-containing protein-like isoform X2 [Hyperolius riggenbachi]|uniref:ankyrin and armadillo repeat-containing protein-like isoform X2 n=1 Tax=Hyperolius riggenbachi TaxID=752182 RepID=UPI0035A2A667
METLNDSGWSEIHQAAYKSHISLVERLIESSGTESIDVVTDDPFQNTPLLLAVSSGTLQMVSLLIKLGADVTYVNRQQQGVVDMCVLHGHYHLLQYFIDLHHQNLNVYKKLIALLDSETEEDLIGSTSMISKLTSQLENWSDGHLKKFVDDGLVTELTDLFQRNLGDTVKVAGLNLLTNVLSHEIGRREFLKKGGIQVLVSLINNGSRQVVSGVLRCIGQLAIEKEYAEEFSEALIPALRKVLSASDQETSEEILQSALQVMGLIASTSSLSKETIGKPNGLLAQLVKVFPLCHSKSLISSWSEAVRYIAEGNQPNQNSFIDENISTCLHQMFRSKNREIQMLAVETLHRLVEGNLHAQKRIMGSSNFSSLVHLLRRSKSQRSQECIAGAAWVLAGADRESRRTVAARIGVPMLVEFLSAASSALNLIGTGGLTALVQGPYDVRNAIYSANGPHQLVRLLRLHQEDVVLSAIQALQHICLGIGFIPHVKNQTALADARGLKFLIALMRLCDCERVRVAAALTIAASVLGHTENQELMMDRSSGFTYSYILHLLRSADDEVRLTAGTALATFAFNSASQQKEIVQCGGVTWGDFSHFLESANQNQRAWAAFQLVVLAPIIPDKDPSYTCALGIQTLMELLERAPSSDTLALTADCVARLSHCRAGLAAAMVSIDVVTLLCDLLASPSEQVKGSAAIALSFLNLHPPAERQLLNRCRQDPRLMKVLVYYNKKRKWPDTFLERWKHMKQLTLPPIRATILQSSISSLFVQ